MSNQLHAQLIRGFLAARGGLGSTRGAGTDLRWEGESGTILFRAIKNPLPPVADGVDRNTGDDKPCILTALVADFSGLPDLTTPAAIMAAQPAGAANLPGQGDSFSEAACTLYPVAAVEHVPGHPFVHFTIQNAAPIVS